MKRELNHSRQVARLAATLLLAAACHFPVALTAQMIASNGVAVRAGSRNSLPAPAPLSRLLVKFKAPVAQEIETNLTFSLSQPPSARIPAWLKKYRMQTLRPLYPAGLKQKIQTGRSDYQMAQAARDKFPRRARRAPENFNPPGILRAYVLEAPGLSPQELRATLKQLQADRNIEFAQLDQVAQAQFIPDDPYFNSSGSWSQSYGDLYGLTNISCPAAWNIASGTGVVVAVIDTGVDYRHRDITNQVWINSGEIPGNGIDDDGNGYVDDVRGWNFVGAAYADPQPDNDPVDHFGHGTHVAGTIAAEANNNLGIPGVAWGAKVMAVKGLDDQGYGSDSELASAIIYAADNGADVINASWGSPGTSPALKEAVNYAVSLGVVFVAAAGNSSADVAKFRPSNFSAAIAVSASTPSNTVASFSNYGYGLDVAAPGVDILSLRAANVFIGKPLNSDYTRLDGTSMATPHVTGTAALILSLHPNYTPEEVRQALRKSADRIYTGSFDTNSGYGRINAGSALALGPVLQARILDPARQATAEGAVAITGVAQGANFSSYTLDYGAGDDPDNWLSLLATNSAVDHATLGRFDTSDLADGRYTVRLRAFDSFSAVFEDRLQINVDNTAIASPVMAASPQVASEYKAGINLQITGTTLNSNFQKFQVDWAGGFNADAGWTNAGMILTGGGNQPVTNSVLANWDTGVVTQAGYATIRLQTITAAFTNEARTMVYLEPDLYSTNWPQTLDEGWDGFPPSVQLAHDSAGGNTLIVSAPQQGGDLLSRLWRFSIDGSSVTNYPVDQSRYALAAVAELDGRPGDETVVAQNHDARIFQPDGSFINTHTLSTNLQFAQVLPTLVDLDGDGVPEILACANNPTNTGSWIYAWKSDGTLFSSNFPINLPDGSILPGQILPVDIDGDGIPELVVAFQGTNYDFSLKMFGADGRPVTWATPVFTGGCLRLAAGDLDGDGRPAIIMAQDDADDEDWLYTFTADGAIRPGWPVRVASDSQIRLLVADFDRDGRNEVVAASANFDGGGGSIHVFRADGSLFPGAWPVGVSGMSHPVAADIDGDGKPEILVTGMVSVPGTNGMLAYSSATLLAYRADGTLARSWHLPGAEGYKPFTGDNIVVGDFDGDGKVDMAVNYGLIPADGDEDSFAVGGVLTVLRLNAPYAKNLRDWPATFHDARNSAVGFIPAKLRLAGTNFNFRLSWPRQPEPAFVQMRDDLSAGSWSTLPAPIISSNGLNTVLVPSTNPHRFYRLQYP